jgi:hypothetical protein
VLFTVIFSDCFKTSSNRYNGFKSTTYDGHTCQRWDSQTPHKHSRNQADRFPDASVADAANYCRDPDDEGLPWCYTTDPDVRWQLCGIHKCPGGKWHINRFSFLSFSLLSYFNQISSEVFLSRRRHTAGQGQIILSTGIRIDLSWVTPERCVNNGHFLENHT